MNTFSSSIIDLYFLLFVLKKENETIKERIIKDIRNLFEHEEEDYYNPLAAVNFCSNNYIECESNGDRNKTISFKEYLTKIRSYVKDIINDLKNLIYGKSK